MSVVFPVDAGWSSAITGSWAATLARRPIATCSLFNSACRSVAITARLVMSICNLASSASFRVARAMGIVYTASPTVAAAIRRLASTDRFNCQKPFVVAGLSSSHLTEANIGVTLAAKACCRVVRLLGLSSSMGAVSKPRRTPKVRWSV